MAIVRKTVVRKEGKRDREKDRDCDRDLTSEISFSLDFEVRRVLSANDLISWKTL
jgi:hypothetical protein